MKNIISFAIFNILPATTILEKRISLQSSTTTSNSLFNRKVLALSAIGGVGVAAVYLMYRRNNTRDKVNESQTKQAISESHNSAEQEAILSNSNHLEMTSNSQELDNQTQEHDQLSPSITIEMNSGANITDTAIQIGTEAGNVNVVQSKENSSQSQDLALKEMPVNEHSCQQNSQPDTAQCQMEGLSTTDGENKQQSTSSVLHLDFLQQHVLQPEVNWAELVEAEEERREAKELKKQQKGSTPGESHSSEEMQSVNGPKPIYSGRNSTSSVRQHPVNGICTCTRCQEMFQSMHSSRGYKNAESPHSTHSEGSADSGRATGPLTSCSPFADEFGQSEVLPIYEFEVPNTLVGLIIGIKGKTIRELCVRANVRMLIRPHHTASKYDTHQICSVEGRREDINKCLHMIRLRFPPCRFPDLNLKPVLPPPPTISSTNRGAPTALTLPVGVPCEVYISAHVDAGHFFLQLPTHPTFSSLNVLDQFMLSVYTQPGGAPEIPKPCNVGVLCAAPAYNGWFRAITLAYDPDQDETLVRFVDYGGFARLPRADLRQIRTDFMTLPMQGIECYLANVQPIDGTSHWSEKANELFQQLCVSKIIQAALLGYCKHDGIPCVELYVLDENKKTVRVDQMLLERGLAKPADPTILCKPSLLGSN